MHRRTTFTIGAVVLMMAIMHAAAAAETDDVAEEPTVAATGSAEHGDETSTAHHDANRLAALLEHFTGHASIENMDLQRPGSSSSDDDQSEERPAAPSAPIAGNQRAKPRVNRGFSAPVHQDLYERTGRRVHAGKAHEHNSHPDVASMQKSAPPRVSFKRKNFGLKYTVTDLVNITFAVGGKRLGSVLLGLFGEHAPRTTRHFLQLVRGANLSSSLVGSRCVRIAPRYIVQCGDFGPATDTAIAHSVSALLTPEGPKVRRAENPPKAIKHSSGVVSMLVTTRVENDGDDDEGKKKWVGSHFMMVGTPEHYHFDGTHIPFGQVLSGYLDVVLIGLMQHVPMDPETMAPRKGFEVTITDAWARPFARGSTLEFEQRSVSAVHELYSRSMNTQETGMDDDEDLLVAAETAFNKPLLVPLPPHVVTRYYEPPPGTSPEDVRRRREEAKRRELYGSTSQSTSMKDSKSKKRSKSQSGSLQYQNQARRDGRPEPQSIDLTPK
jgi:cyclophilin family peptidyl-prolyl cis-trans isomerase